MQNKFLPILVSLLIFSCGSEEQTEIRKDESNKEVKAIEETVDTPVFNADTAYAYIQNQVDFGPRIPNTAEHDSCGAWIKRKMESFGFEVIVQKGQDRAWSGDVLKIENIICQYNPADKNRIMLCAHWDTRPYADRDENNQTKPILGANDGGSGVGVLMEIARQISLTNPKTGVDIIFFDTEDYGRPAAVGMHDLSSMSDTWCLGSQYWSKNPPIPGYSPRYGILLDMVGADSAVFYKEGISTQYAGQQVNRIWKEAEVLGYEKYFVKKIAPAITDDHTYINQITGIPTLDIVHYAPRGSFGRFDFGHFHHTHKDNMDIISRETLKAVGQTVLHVVYQKI